MNTPWYLAGSVLRSECVVAYQPIGAANLQVSLINLANPGCYDAQYGVSPIFNPSTGWEFNGSTQYLNSTFIPKRSQQQALIVRFTGSTTTSQYIAGSYDSGGWGTGFGVSAGVVYGNGSYLVSSAQTNGILAVSGNKGYKNGVLDSAGTISDYVRTPAQPVFIGAWNSNGVPLFYGLVSVQALAIYNIALTDAQVLAITQAMKLLSFNSLPDYNIPRHFVSSRLISLFPHPASSFNPAWTRGSNILIPGVSSL